MLNTKYGLVTLLVASALSGQAQASGIQGFLDSLRDFESGINPALADFYAQNLDNPVYTYAQVTVPGRLVRDCSTGVMISEPTTISQFLPNWVLIIFITRTHPTIRKCSGRCSITP